ncbi:SsrA-binding protein SmpB [Candidatus Saccharibacteria bacterium]|nr:SsrA-binding protein SmpB [Candidatus Saccharibacteria bacterium]
MKLLAKNKRATYDYQLDERLVAGIVLTGDEVKSIKAAKLSLKGSFIGLQNNEAWLMGAHVTPYDHSSRQMSAIDPTRHRKLLLHRRQLAQLVAAKQNGMSVVPTIIGLERNLVKIEIGIGRGKKNYDKRASIKARDTDREIARNVVR